VVRRFSLEAAENVGPLPKSAEPVLRKLLEDEDKHVRQAAREALEKIRGKKE